MSNDKLAQALQVLAKASWDAVDVRAFAMETLAEYEAEKQAEPVAWQHRKPIEGPAGETTGYTEWRDGRGLEWWPHRPLYAAPPSSESDKEDAERYRAIKAILYADYITIGEAYLTLHVTGVCPDVSEWDAAIDAAMGGKE